MWSPQRVVVQRNLAALSPSINSAPKLPALLKLLVVPAVPRQHRRPILRRNNLLLFKSINNLLQSWRIYQP
jgi:hypothetical protein